MLLLLLLLFGDQGKVTDMKFDVKFRDRGEVADMKFDVNIKVLCVPPGPPYATDYKPAS